MIIFSIGTDRKANLSLKDADLASSTRPSSTQANKMANSYSASNSKDAELARLKAEVNKFQSVLDAKSPVPGAGPLGSRVKSDLLATINEEALMVGQESRQKKQGVSGESAQTGHGVEEIKHYDKDFKYLRHILINFRT